MLGKFLVLILGLGMLTGCNPSSSSSLEVAITGLEAVTYVNGSLTFNIAVVGGRPDSLELRRDGQLFQPISGSSFTWDISNTPEASYTFVVRARRGSQTFDSLPKQVVVDRTPPTVSLTATPSVTPLVLPGSIALSATAGDTNGGVRLEFLNGTTKLGEDSVEPFGLNLTLEAAQKSIYSLTAKAIDRAGNAAQTPIQTVGAYIRQTVTLTSEAALDGCIDNAYTGLARTYIFGATSCTYGTSYAILHFFSFDRSAYPGAQIERAALRFRLQGVGAAAQSKLVSVNYVTTDAAPPISQTYPYTSSETEADVSLAPGVSGLTDQQSLVVTAQVQADVQAGRTRSQLRFRTLNFGPSGLGGTIYFAEAGGSLAPTLELQMLVP